MMRWGIKTGKYQGRRTIHVIDFTCGGKVSVCFGRYDKYMIIDISTEAFWEWCAKYRAKLVKEL